jgi:hypothetical protein
LRGRVGEGSYVCGRAQVERAEDRIEDL